MFRPGTKVLVGHESEMPVENLSEGTWVYSLDKLKGCFSRITRRSEERLGGEVGLMLDNGLHLVVSPETKVLVKGTVNGWKRASSLRPSMKVMSVVAGKPAWALVAVVSLRPEAPAAPTIILEARPHRTVIVNGVACRA